MSWPDPYMGPDQAIERFAELAKGARNDDDRRRSMRLYEILFAARHEKQSADHRVWSRHGSAMIER